MEWADVRAGLCLDGRTPTSRSTPGRETIQPRRKRGRAERPDLNGQDPNRHRAAARAERRFVLGVGVTYGDMVPQHPLIETEARPQFLNGKREQAVLRVHAGSTGPGTQARGPRQRRHRRRSDEQGLRTGGRLTGPRGGERRAGRDPGTVRWRACGTSQPAWSPPGGLPRCARGGRSGAGQRAFSSDPRSRRGSARGGRLSGRPGCRLPMVSGGPYTAVPITRKSPGHAHTRQISHPNLTPPRPGRAGPAPSLSP